MQLHTYIVLFEINTNFRLNKQKSTNINIKTCSNKLFHIYKIQIVFLYIQYVYCFEIARKIKFSQQKQLKLLPSQENDQEKLLSSKKMHSLAISSSPASCFKNKLMLLRTFQ